MPILETDQLSDVDAWLRSILWESRLPSPKSDTNFDVARTNSFEIHRLKARLPFSNGDVKIVQGVREVFEILDAPKLDDSLRGSALGKVVLIGRNLESVPFEESLLRALKF